VKPLLDLKVRLESIVRVSDQAIVAKELLLRPVAGGCIVDHAARAHIDMAWVTGYALEAAGALLEHGRRPLHVNITPADLARPSFVPMVHRSLTIDGLGLLILEVTEHTPLLNSDQVQRTLLALRRLGVRFAIDDYGDGWADMTSVEIVKPEIIKVRLDRLRAGRTGAELADALRDASERLHAHVVVEQVETCSDLLTVRALGFTHAQGWYWTADPDCRR
jgi:EAL domain-containing protein (putative c-di-GMP-specific phosphodiesterase class I)